MLIPQACAGCLRLCMLAQEEGVSWESKGETGVEGRREERDQISFHYRGKDLLHIYSQIVQRDLNYYTDTRLRAEKEQRENKSETHLLKSFFRAVSCVYIAVYLLLSADLINWEINMTFQGNRDRVRKHFYDVHFCSMYCMSYTRERGEHSSCVCCRSVWFFKHFWGCYWKHSFRFLHILKLCSVVRVVFCIDIVWFVVSFYQKHKGKKVKDYSVFICCCVNCKC